MTTNYHVLIIKYIGPGNYTPSKVKIISERFQQSITFSFDRSDIDGTYTIDKAQNWLISKGFEVVGTGEGKGHYYLISTTFKPLKGE